MGGFSGEKERRQFIRIDEHHLLKYRVCEDDQVLSFIRNISGGGVLFHSKEPLEAGTTLEMKISLPPEEKPLDVVVKVRHVKELEKLGGYNVGAEFVHIDEKDRSLIERKIYPSDEDRTDAA